MRIGERISFQLLDHGISGDLVPESIKAQIEKTTGTVHDVGTALGAAAAGTVLIIGSSLLPKELKWAPYLKTAGIVAGVALALVGTSYAFQTPPSGVVPGAPNLFVAPNLVLAAEQGWKIFGTPRIDLTVTNKSGAPVQLSIAAKDYIGTAVNEALLEMPWNPESMDLAPSASDTKSFYFVTDRIKAAPGPRTVSFVVSDRQTGQVFATWQKTVNFS